MSFLCATLAISFERYYHIKQTVKNPHSQQFNCRPFYDIIHWNNYSIMGGIIKSMRHDDSRNAIRSNKVKVINAGKRAVSQFRVSGKYMKIYNPYVEDKDNIMLLLAYYIGGRR